MLVIVGYLFCHIFLFMTLICFIQARRFAESIDNAVWTNQFDNTANRQAHIETTGPEIWQETSKAF